VIEALVIAGVEEVAIGRNGEGAVSARIDLLGSAKDGLAVIDQVLNGPLVRLRGRRPCGNGAGEQAEYDAKETMAGRKHSQRAKGGAATA